MLLNSWYCTLFLIIAFCMAGVLQTLWLRIRISGRLARPLDCGLTFRGRQLFGKNKTWKGFVVMIPAVGLAFLTLACVSAQIGGTWQAGLWPLTNGTYFWLGCWGGLGFMLGELPNSFVKRQLDIAPGVPPSGVVARGVSFFVDQADSVLGALLALSLFVSIPVTTWIAILLAGPAAHWVFNLVLMLVGVKTRAA
jgi:hypothetical protein